MSRSVTVWAKQKGKVRKLINVIDDKVESDHHPITVLFCTSDLAFVDQDQCRAFTLESILILDSPVPSRDFSLLCAKSLLAAFPLIFWGFSNLTSNFGDDFLKLFFV
jgi:hypothetical protein